MIFLIIVQIVDTTHSFIGSGFINAQNVLDSFVKGAVGEIGSDTNALIAPYMLMQSNWPRYKMGTVR